MKKSIIIVLVILIILVILGVIFFYPKINSKLDDSFTAQTTGEYKNVNCNCIGIAKMQSGLTRPDTQIQLCYGIPINCVYDCNKVVSNKWTSVDCSEITNG